MLTAEECLAKADEAERLANVGPPEIHDSYIRMASEWRILAAQAACQDLVAALFNSEPAQTQRSKDLRGTPTKKEVPAIRSEPQAVGRGEHLPQGLKFATAKVVPGFTAKTIGRPEVQRPKGL